jgi:hypothetical protein
MQRHLDCSTSFPDVTAGSVHPNRLHIIHRMDELLTKQPHHFWWRGYFYYRTVLSRPSLCTAFCPMWWTWVTHVSCVSRVTQTGLCPPTVTAVQTRGPAWKFDVSLGHNKERWGTVQNVDSRAPVFTWYVSRQLMSSDGLQNAGMRAVFTWTAGQNVTHRLKSVGCNPACTPEIDNLVDW